ncbi:TfuA-like protein [Longimicrobium sp.]|uniref:TfuA-like protein n=1 Tax=Longimicrobium sp. TaxID=2029185 RepID=UPI002BAA0E1A|nr:TfuA-like protein [Longimicrobium sp.]HSU17053.1 TfuA-like protein [Longimicrobium sp.]
MSTSATGSPPPSVLFAGPTCAPLDPALPARAGFELRPPARRGDVAALLGGAPGTVVLVDGNFHQSLAVGHAELRAALEGGWRVWGVGSMGAIRAWEMRHLGMRGFGRVYEHFLGEDDFQDDEVALLHAPDPPYLPVSEPLVHIRWFLRGLEESGALDGAAAGRVATELKALWYGDRTLELTLALVERHGGPAAGGEARRRMDDFDPWRVKTRDLADFLERGAWRDDGYRPTPRPAPYGPGDTGERLPA